MNRALWWRPAQILLLTGAAVGWLAGCATLPPQDLAADQTAAAALFAKHAEQVRHITDWRATGRMAVRTEQAGGSLSFDWQQHAAVTQLVLNAPLNQGTITLTGTPELMRIEDSSGRSQITQHPDQTVSRLTGWQIPIQALPNWIRALPYAADAKTQFNPLGQLIRLHDDGWTLHYSDYRPAFAAGIPMPHQMTASQNGVFLRLIIDQWQALPHQQ